MGQDISTSILKFKSLTNVNLNNFFRAIDSFFKVNFFLIENYYKGKNIYDKESFDYLDKLLERVDYILYLFNFNKQNFGNLDDWELLDLLEETKTKLETVKNLSKYSRSIIKKGESSFGIKGETALNQFGTLEKISDKVLHSIEKEDDWVDIAFFNDLKEEDYTSKGGILIEVIFPRNNVFLNTVVDNLEGKKLYGKDIQNKLEFKENDLVVLGYNETLSQSLNILLNLKKGDNPEFANYGIQTNLFVGNNLNIINYPILYKQLINIFLTDDTISTLSVKDLNLKQDKIFLEFEIETRYGEIYNRELNL